MTRDYAKRPKRATPVRNTRHQPTRKTLPGWLWMVGGILVGALVMAVINYSPAPVQDDIPEVIAEPEVEPDNNTPRPRFDFYTLLKESEVILNDDETPPPSTVLLPSPTLPPPSQPRDNAADDTRDAPGTTPDSSTESTPVPAQPSAPVVAAPAPQPAGTAQAQPNEPAVQPPQDTPPPVAQPEPPRDVFLLQAGSFKSADDADNLRVRLLLLNMQARVETVSPRPGETWHRVQVGPFDNTQSLADARSVLQQNGIASIQVKKTR